MKYQEPSDYLHSYLAGAVRGDRRQAIRLALDLLDQGISQDRIVDELIGAAQSEVGERWYRNELSVADEHVATGVSAAALDALVSEAGPLTGEGHTVVACAEGEWHALAAQMFGESLRFHGVGVTVLGASIPADFVIDFLVRRGADSLAVSCTLPIFFPGVARLVDAAHREGFPVIVGGRAFGNDSRRAERVGADAWSRTAGEAEPIVGLWRVEPPAFSHRPTALDPIALRLSARAGELAHSALDTLASRLPSIADVEDEDEAMIRAHEYFVFIVQFMASAILVDDDAILTDYLHWLQTLLVSRGAEPHALITGLEALRPWVEAVDVCAVRILDAGRRQLVEA